MNAGNMNAGSMNAGGGTAGAQHTAPDGDRPGGNKAGGIANEAPRQSAGNSVNGAGGGDRENGANAANAGPRWRELHIRLDKSPVRHDEDLLPLRDQLIGNPGPCQVFIHVPVPEGRETVIRTASQISSSATGSSVDALRRCRGVAEVWGE
jgi:DNA polymerase-3 subunit alpha